MRPWPLNRHFGFSQPRQCMLVVPWTALVLSPCDSPPPQFRPFSISFRQTTGTRPVRIPPSPLTPFLQKHCLFFPFAIRPTLFTIFCFSPLSRLFHACLRSILFKGALFFPPVPLSIESFAFFHGHCALTFCPIFSSVGFFPISRSILPRVIRFFFPFE